MCRSGPLIGALGITGIAIAFALTAILENVFASVVLKTRRPIKIGDQITTHDHSGTVEEINFRTVVLRNFDGEKVVLPSSMVNNERVVNHTDRPTRRTVLPVGVAYGTDLAHAQSVILQAVQGVARSARAPQRPRRGSRRSTTRASTSTSASGTSPTSCRCSGCGRAWRWRSRRRSTPRASRSRSPSVSSCSPTGVPMARGRLEPEVG